MPAMLQSRWVFIDAMRLPCNTSRYAHCNMGLLSSCLPPDDSSKTGKRAVSARHNAYPDNVAVMVAVFVEIHRIIERLHSHVQQYAMPRPRLDVVVGNGAANLEVVLHGDVNF